MNDDIITACADLVDRAGATSFDIGYLHDNPDNPGWYAIAYYQGARITADDHRTPAAAALALAERLLTRAACRCGDTVTLSDSRPGCRWQLRGARWEPGCDAPPIHARRGDHAAMSRQAENRAQRRAAAKGHRRRG